jgi:hypothetical protein
MVFEKVIFDQVIFDKVIFDDVSDSQRIGANSNANAIAPLCALTDEKPNWKDRIKSTLRKETIQDKINFSFFEILFCALKFLFFIEQDKIKGFSKLSES